MKTTLNGVWNIRQRKFESENGQLLIYWNIPNTRKKLEELGRYHPDGEIMRRVMPIKITNNDNQQIISAIYKKF